MTTIFLTIGIFAAAMTAMTSRPNLGASVVIHCRLRVCLKRARVQRAEGRETGHKKGRV